MLNPLLIKQGRTLLRWFKINDKPASEMASDGEVEIFLSIALKLHPRIACLAPTGYGKSEFIACGATFRTHFYHEDFIIASVKFGTSDIIMDKTINHIFDDSRFIDELEIVGTEKLSRLKAERKKSHLTFKRGGSIKIVSLFGPDMDITKTIGEHVPNIILDESPLLSASKYLQVLKILEGTGKYEETFLFELGNAVNRNHFRQNVLFNPNYYKINISLDQAIAEGRLDPKMVEEKRNMPFFEQFYLNKFPEEDDIDEKGYRQLLTSEEIEAISKEQVDLTDEPMALGVDIGGGGDKNVFVIRQGNHAWIETSNRSNDTMTNVNEVIAIIDKYEVDLDGQNVRLLKPQNVFIDDIGIGRGVVDRLNEMKDEKNRYYYVQGVSVGMPAEDKDKFKNIKAENYWRARMWITAKDKAGKLINKLQPAAEWTQLTWLKYKISTDKVVQIEPKEDLKKRTGKSPDYAESLMLTFSSGSPEPGITILNV